ncbi:hypothetical protein [Micromonospora sp. SL4-19]|uniref:hypothetical protein n=1 Tax=Micromonospora sp. SL4-19 TaxID=3399129 RepID=UPI003A4DF00D
MTAFNAALLAVDILLAGACVAMLVLAAVVLVRSRRTGTARLFGRAMHRPGLWASAVVCLVVAGLMMMSSEFMPGGWQKSTSVIYGMLWLAFLLLIVTHSLSQLSAERRRARERQARP